MNILSSILKPIEWAIAWLLTALHAALTMIGLPHGPSNAWCLAIMLMTVAIRLCLLPLFIRQIRASRRMLDLQPQLQRIQRKYRNRRTAASAEAMQRETADLYRRYHASPMGSCLPSLVQGPILCSLYYVLSSLPSIATGAQPALGGIDRNAAADIERSMFINVRLSDTMMSASGDARLTIGITVALMCVTMFTMQWLMIHCNTSLKTMAESQMRMQKATAFILPVVYMGSGSAMPYGVLLYWVTSNLWNLGQTLCQLYWFPTPGSAAGNSKETRDHDRENARRAATGRPSLEEEALAEAKAAASARNEAQRSRTRSGQTRGHAVSRRRRNGRRR